MITAVEVAPQAGYRIWLRYADGVSGEVVYLRLTGKSVEEVMPAARLARVRA